MEKLKNLRNGENCLKLRNLNLKNNFITGSAAILLVDNIFPKMVANFLH